MWYFLCLGAGYILIQVALIQKFVLLLGHPTYALTVIVFSMLVASGVGSYFSRRVIAGEDRRLMMALAGVAVLITALAFVASPLSAAAAGWPTFAKMAVTAISIAPAAFLMGMPFPSGLAPVGRTTSALGALGMVDQRGGQRARIGRSDCAGDLFGTAGDDADRRRRCICWRCW